MKGRRKRVTLVKFKDVKRTMWKAFDSEEFLVAKELSFDKCKAICKRKGYAI